MMPWRESRWGDSAAREAAWEQLRGRLDLHDGFWLGFMFGLTPRRVGELADRSANYLQMTARSVMVRDLTNPVDLAEATGWLLGRQEEAHSGLGLIWVIDPTGRADEEWRAGWRSLLLRLNERREAVRTRVPIGLVLTGPTWLLPLVRDVAPDLWSYRATICLAPAPSRATEPAPPGLIPGPSDPPSADLDRFVDLAVTPAVEPSPAVAPLIREAEGEMQAGRMHRVAQLAAQALAAATAPADEALALALLALGQEAQKNPAAALDQAHAALLVGQPLGPDRTREMIDILAAGSDPALAEWALQRRVAMARREVATRDGSLEPLRALSLGLDRLGEIHQAQSDLDAALTAYTEALDLARRLHTANGSTPHSLYDLSYTLNRVGSLHQARQEPAAAAAAYDEALRWYERLSSEYGSSYADEAELAELRQTAQRARAAAEG